MNYEIGEVIKIWIKINSKYKDGLQIEKDIIKRNYQLKNSHKKKKTMAIK